jgi:hypothetical protein
MVNWMVYQKRPLFCRTLPVSIDSRIRTKSLMYSFFIYSKLSGRTSPICNCSPYNSAPIIKWLYTTDAYSLLRGSTFSLSMYVVLSQAIYSSSKSFLSFASLNWSIMTLRDWLYFSVMSDLSLSNSSSSCLSTLLRPYCPSAV